MPCYLVRVIDDQQAVGIYAADDLEDLNRLVDEILDAAECEAAEIPSGGITWPRRGAKPVPLPLGEFDEDLPPVINVIGEASVTEAWFEALFEQGLEFQQLSRP